MFFTFFIILVSNKRRIKMHVNKLTIGEFLPKRLGFKKNVVTAPKPSVTQNAMLSQIKSQIGQLKLPEKFKNLTLSGDRFERNKFNDLLESIESKCNVDTNSILKTPLSVEDI